MFICVDFIVEDTILAKEKQNESFQKISINEQGIWIPLCYATFIFVPFIISFCFPRAILLPLLYYFVFKCMVGLAKDKNSVYIYNDISGAQQG